MTKTVRAQQLFWFPLLCILAGHLQGERIYTVGTTLNLVASVDDNPQVSGRARLTGAKRVFLPVYAAYPEITINSEGPRSFFNLSYSFGLNRIENDALDLDYESHTLQGFLNTNLTRNLSLAFTESFMQSPDFSTSSLFRGLVSTPEGVFLDFDTIALRRKSYSTSESLTLDYRLNPNSDLSLSFGHYLRNYEQTPDFESGVSDQSSFNGNLKYTGSISPRTSWNLAYSLSQFVFQEFEDVQTHNIAIGLSRQISPTVLFTLETGPSYTEVLGTSESFSSWRNGTLSISKSFEDNLLSIFYSARSGTTTGVGYVSDAQSVGLALSRSAGRRIRLATNVSLYKNQRRLDNPIETRGLSVSQFLNFSLTDQWFLVLGGSYQTQAGTDAFDFERRRVFISFRLMLPELLRFQR